MTDNEIRVYSTKLCPHCKHLKAFLTKHHVTFMDIDVGADRDAAQEMINLTGQRSVPVLVAHGKVVIGFDKDAVVNLLQLKQDVLDDEHELIIIGAGAAGLAAAMYAGRKGLKTLVIGAARGGMVALSDVVENYPGFYQISGDALMTIFSEQSLSYGAVLHDDEVTDLTRSGDMFVVDTLAGRKFSAKAVIIAVGRTPKVSGVPGEERLFGKGISICTTCDGPIYAHQRVAVYGGGSSAVEMALEMSEIADKVYLISRSQLDAETILIERMKDKENIELLTGFVITEMRGTEKLTSILIAPREHPENAETLVIDALFLGVGLQPNTKAFANIVATNSHQEIVVDENCRTNVLGIFAAGDATSIEGKQMAVAVGEGVKALLSAYTYLKK